MVQSYQIQFLLIMLKAVKVRLYPNTEQKQHLAQSFGCARWYWNYSLALTQKTYQQTGKGLSRGAIQGLLPNLKKEMEGLLVKGVDDLNPQLS